MAFRFEVIKKDAFSKARLGRVETDHGSFSTPAFLPVGTQGSVKSLTPEELVEIGVEAILGNTLPPLPSAGARDDWQIGRSSRIHPLGKAHFNR